MHKLNLTTLMFTIALISFVAFASSSHASVVNGVEYGNGLTFQTGTIFFNTTEPVYIDPEGDLTDPENVVNYGTVSGVGTVSEIRTNDNTIVWQYNDNPAEVEYNYLFNNIIVDYRDDNLALETFSYGDTGGIFEFYSNERGTFQTTGNSVTDATSIAGGLLNLSAEGYMVNRGDNEWSIVGSGDPSANTGFGNIFFTGGDAFNLIAQGGIETVDGTFADSTFNFSTGGLGIDESGYDRKGSVDMDVGINEVPLPATLWLFGAGIMSLIGFSRRKTA